MIEKTGNFWDEPGDVHVITTNGVVKGNGACVMGRGIALQAKTMFPGIDKVLGDKIMKEGNVVHDLEKYINKDREFHIYSFPVKEHWKDKADILIISRSLAEIVKLQYEKIIMVRPGCGNGRLSWKYNIKGLIQNYLDDRFIVVNQT